MLGLAIAIALILALVFSARRVEKRRRLARLMLELPGAQPDSALPVGSFDDIDEELRRRRCPCGGAYDVLGEGSRAEGDRRLRFMRVECDMCERETIVFFDVSTLFH